jgi:hypothetical protein
MLAAKTTENIEVQCSSLSHFPAKVFRFVSEPVAIILNPDGRVF